MAFAETANLAVKMTLGGNFTSQMAKASRAARGFDKDASRAFKAGQQIGTGIKRGAYIAAGGIAFLATQVGFGLDQLVELESLTAQTNAVLKSTKGVAGQTAESIRNLAEKYEGLNAQVDDKAIQNAANVLLTFRQVGKSAFEPAIEAALNMSTALGTDLQGAVIQVGKALADPVKGITALRRAGVTFSANQIKVIKNLVKTGDTLGAQRVILRELNREFGGSFLAGGTTTAGKVAKFGDAIEDLQKSLATALLPAVSNIADALNELLRDPAIITATEKLGEEIGQMFSKQNIQNGIAAIKEGFLFIKSIAGPIASVVGSVVKAFTSLPPELQKLLVGGVVINKLTGGLATNLIGAAADLVFKKLGLMTVAAGVVNVSGPVAGLPGGGPGGIAGTVAKGAPLGLAATGLGLAGAATLGGAIGGAIARAAGEVIDPGANRAADEGRGLGNRDPRRFNQDGQVTTNYLPKIAAGTDRSIDIAEQTRAAFNQKAEQQKAAIQAAANKNTTDAERIRGQVSTSSASSTAQIVSAIHGIDLTVQPTTVNKITNIEARYGPAFGSRNTSAKGFFGNGGFGGR